MFSYDSVEQMGFLQNSGTGEWKWGRIVAVVIALGLFIWLAISLNSPISNDTQCDPPRTNLTIIANISGYILWGLLALIAIYYLFIQKNAVGRSRFGQATHALPRGASPRAMVRRQA